MTGNMDYIKLVIILLCLVMGSWTYSRNDSIRLMDDMLTGYNRKHRPVLNQSEPLIVNISCDVVSIQDIDEVNGIFTLVVVLYMQWYDETIIWDPASYGGIQSQIYDIEDVWYPLFVTSSSTESFKDIVEDWMTLRINSSGLVKFAPGLLIKSTCEVDVTHYPFDVQTCSVTLTPWVETVTEVKIQATVPYCFRNFYTGQGEWTIVDNSTTTDPMLGYIFTLSLKRKPLFAVVNIILPIIFMAILNLLVYAIPVESGERISYTITVLLAIAVFLTLVAESLPKTSEPMSLMSFFLMIMLVCSTSICVGTIWTVHIYYRTDGRRIPEWQCKIARLVKGDCMRTKATIDKDSNPESPHHHIDQEDTDHPLTWQDISSALDRCLLVIFSIVIILNTLGFMIALTI